MHICLNRSLLILFSLLLLYQITLLLFHCLSLINFCFIVQFLDSDQQIHTKKSLRINLLYLSTHFRKSLPHRPQHICIICYQLIPMKPPPLTRNPQPSSRILIKLLLTQYYRMDLHIVSLFKLVVLVQVCHMLVPCKVHERMFIQQKFMLLIRYLIVIANVFRKLCCSQCKVWFFRLLYFLGYFTFLTWLLILLWLFNLDLLQYFYFLCGLLAFSLFLSLLALINAIFLKIILLAIFRS